MGKFIFHDEITIDFGNGITFKIPDDKHFVTEDLQKINQDYLESVQTHPDDDRAALNDTLDAIDKILGSGATGRIFKGHKLSPNNVIGAYFYIVNEILEQHTAYAHMIDEMKGRYEQHKTAVDINPATKAAAETKLAELGILPNSMPSAAEAALRPRL